MDLLSTLPGSLMEGFLPRGWDLEKIDRLGAAGPAELVRRESWWHGQFEPVACTTLADFDTYCIAAPADSRLPGGGTNRICDLYNVAPAKFSVPAQNFVTLASNYGKQIEHWNGVDFSAKARLISGMTSDRDGSRQRSSRIHSIRYRLGLTTTSASSIDACSRIVTACAPGRTRTLRAVSVIQRRVPWQ